jgi:serpin B
VAVSPASLDLALSMLVNGARGSTASQIAHVLGTTGMSDAALNGQWAALTQAWSGAATKAGIDFSSANSVWVDKGFGVAHAFMAALAQYYGAGVWQVDFQHQMQAALAALDSWTSQHTHGRITKLFTSLPAQTVLVLANAIYFKAAWAVPFNANLTQPAAFTLASGASVRTSFMSSGEAQNYACGVTSDYQAVALPYRGGRFAAEVIMPTHGSLSSFVAGLSGTALTDIAASLHPQSAVVELPKFSLSTTTDLVPVLSQLGMPDAFGGTADFSGMSSTPTQIGAAIQRVYLRVAEKGTEAAAVTGIAAEPTSATADPALQLRFNHPFLFLVRDVHTGAIMFEAAVANPAA